MLSYLPRQKLACSCILVGGGGINFERIIALLRLEHWKPDEEAKLQSCTRVIIVTIKGRSLAWEDQREKPYRLRHETQKDTGKGLDGGTQCSTGKVQERDRIV